MESELSGSWTLLHNPQREEESQETPLLKQDRVEQATECTEIAENHVESVSGREQNQFEECMDLSESDGISILSDEEDDAIWRHETKPETGTLKSQAVEYFPTQEKIIRIKPRTDSSYIFSEMVPKFLSCRYLISNHDAINSFIFFTFFAWVIVSFGEMNPCNIFNSPHTNSSFEKYEKLLNAHKSTVVDLENLKKEVEILKSALHTKQELLDVYLKSATETNQQQISVEFQKFSEILNMMNEKLTKLTDKMDLYENTSEKIQTNDDEEEVKYKSKRSEKKDKTREGDGGPPSAWIFLRAKARKFMRKAAENFEPYKKQFSNLFH